MKTIARQAGELTDQIDRMAAAGRGREVVALAIYRDLLMLHVGRPLPEPKSTPRQAAAAFPHFGTSTA